MLLGEEVHQLRQIEAPRGRQKITADMGEGLQGLRLGDDVQGAAPDQEETRVDQGLHVPAQATLELADTPRADAELAVLATEEGDDAVRLAQVTVAQDNGLRPVEGGVGEG